MDMIIDISKEDIKDIDTVINSFVSKYADEVVSIGALALCLQTLIDKRNELQELFDKEGK
jgi:hypothetical protein